MVFEHAFKRFASEEASIRASANDSAKFCALLNDYEEICTYLAAQSADNKAGAAELSVARETASSLEKEIEELLARQ